MRKLILICGFVAAAAPAIADPLCDDLWFTRNLIFDAANYCFASPLGDAVFRNEGCTTTDPVLSPRDQGIVARIREIEDEWNCSVDTARVRPLEINIGLRLAMIDQPIATGYESGCIGWRADPMPVMTGHDSTALQIAEITTGDSVDFGYIPIDGWEYVRIRRGGLILEGWARFGEHDPTRCEGWAG